MKFIDALRYFEAAADTYVTIGKCEQLPQALQCAFLLSLTERTCSSKMEGHLIQIHDCYNLLLQGGRQASPIADALIAKSGLEIGLLLLPMQLTRQSRMRKWTRDRQCGHMC